MKIAILTHPLDGNYGGVLQAFALSTFLKQHGHDVTILRRNANTNIIKRLIKQFLIYIKYSRYYPLKFKYIRLFKSKYISESKNNYSSQDLSKFIAKHKFDVVIVGSDQVWRADFAKSYGYDYFLEFVPNSIKKIAYAASFGLSTWDYTNEQTYHIQKLLKSFKAISVREDNGVKLCLNHLNCSAVHVLDPTMLLDAGFYSTLASPRLINENYLFIYWLGSQDEKNKIIEKYNGVRVIDISLREEDILPSIEDWLSYIIYADKVITDSFHGLVFSLLFHKNIAVLPNNKGGNERIMSLFRLFELEGKITKPQLNIDYKSFEDKLLNLREKSIQFLLESIKK